MSNEALDRAHARLDELLANGGGVVSERVAEEIEAAMFARSVYAIRAEGEWVANAPARMREYNRPINRIRRRVGEARRRLGIAWLVIRTGETGEECEDY